LPRRDKVAPSTEAAIDVAVARRFGTLLRRWFRANGRDLPWRKTRDPYHILVSELMLQQTQVSRVVTRYADFIETFPTLHDVARARPKRVTDAWAGLGYYARARNLHALARRVTDRGRDRAAMLPAEAAALRVLPGIGAYTAGAVSSFAYERRAELVDTNVARVIKRVFAPDVDVKSGRGQKRVWSIARELLPRTGRATWVHNQALMELGALVCTARIAHCKACPVRSICATYSRNAESAFSRFERRAESPPALSFRAKGRRPVGAREARGSSRGQTP
jgi:A/G-specific adenine glycosylase